MVVGQGELQARPLEQYAGVEINFTNRLQIRRIAQSKQDPVRKTRTHGEATHVHQRFLGLPGNISNGPSTTPSRRWYSTMLPRRTTATHPLAIGSSCSKQMASPW